MNKDTLDLIQQKQQYHKEMESICSDILAGRPIATTCRNNNVSITSFRYRLLKNDIQSSKFQYDQAALLSLAENLMSPEERVFRDVMKIYDDSLFYVEFPEDFEETVQDLIRDVYTNMRQLEIINLRYYEEKTFDEIAELLHLTSTRIRQIHGHAIRDLRRSDRLKRMILGNKKYDEYVKKATTCAKIDSILQKCSVVDKKDQLYETYKDEIDSLQDSVSEELKKLRIEQLDLSKRVKNCLLRANINTIEDVLNTSNSDLLKIKNFGMNCLVELNRYIEDHRFKYNE